MNQLFAKSTDRMEGATRWLIGSIVCFVCSVTVQKNAVVCC